MPGITSFTPPEQLNVADYFLDDRVREGRGDRTALLTDAGPLSYAEVQTLANRCAHLLHDAGVRPEERVAVCLPDGPEFVGALFGTLKLGSAAVMLNPGLPAAEIRDLLTYTRSVAAFAVGAAADAIEAGVAGHPLFRRLFRVDDPGFRQRLHEAPGDWENFPTHRDDAAIWLFSGGTTGRPKAVVQRHASYAYTTECYAKGVIGYRETDVTLSVPKLYFGYATGSNLLFPFSVGATATLFPERCTPEALFDRIEAHRPTILVNVPTMVQRMVEHPEARERDLSSLRICTSAGEALPVELHRRWEETFGVELLDGLGTAEMWHIFLSNRPGEARPGTLGRPVPGFEVRVCDEAGRELPAGEVGWLWVRGGARAVWYWQRMERTASAFRGEWYVSGDMVRRDADGWFTYVGRGDDMLKVSGKWLSPGEVENCLLQHPAVAEAAVVGVPEPSGLTKPQAFVVLREGAAADRSPASDRSPAADRSPGAGRSPASNRSPAEDAPPAADASLAAELQAFVRERLQPYKYPRRVHFAASLPRTHLGKIDRAELRRRALEAAPPGGGI